MSGDGNALKYIANFGGTERVSAWCYLCGSPHRFGQECLVRTPPARVEVTCQICGRSYVPGRRLVYCSDECRSEAKRRRRREA